MPEAKTATKEEMEKEAAKVVEGLKEGLEKLAVESNGEVKKALPPEEVLVSEVDLLKAENINLRLMVCVNRETIAQNALNEAVRERVSKQEELQAYRAHLESTYGVDLNTHQIDEKTGKVVPRPGHQQMMQHQVQAKLAQAQAALKELETKNKTKNKTENKAEETEDRDEAPKNEVAEAVNETPEAKTG